MFGNRSGIKVGENIEGPSFPEAQPAAGEHKELLFRLIRFRSHGCGAVLRRNGAYGTLTGLRFRRAHTVHDDDGTYDRDRVRVRRNRGIVGVPFRGSFFYG